MNSYPKVFKGSSDVDIMSRRCSLNYYGGCIATTTLDIGVKETQLEQSGIVRVSYVCYVTA